MSQISSSKCKSIENGTERIPLSEAFLLIGFGILLFAKAVGLYEGNKLYTTCLITGGFFIGLRMLTVRMSVLEWIIVILICMLGGVVYGRTGQWGILLCISMIVGMKDAPVKRIFRFGLLIWGTCFIAMAALTETGILDEMILVHDKSGFGWIIRHTLGYTHPNVLHVSYLVLVGFILYVINDSITDRQFICVILALLGGSVAVFISSVSFTGMMATIVYFVFAIYFRFRTRLTRIERVLLELILPIYLIFSLIGPVALYGTHIWEMINRAMTTRYNLAHYFLTEQPITLFGTRFIVPNYRYTMDSSYLYLFMQLGVVTFIIVILAFMGMIRDGLEADQRPMLAMTFGFLTAGLTEPFLFNNSYKNLLLIFLGCWMFRRLNTMADRLPEKNFLKRTFIFIANAENKMVPIQNAACIFCAGRAAFTVWKRHILAWFMIFALGIAVGGTAYRITVPEPSIIYVPEDHMDDHDQPDMVLTEEDDHEIAAEGGLVIGIRNDGQNSLMSIVRESTRKWEYWRRIADAGIWTGFIASVYMILIFFNSRERQN